MKNILFKVVSLTVITVMLCVSFASAASLNISIDQNNLTATVTELGNNEETTILVVDKGTAIETIEDDTSKVFYIDQTAAKNGTASFTFDITDAGDIDIYSGYFSMLENDLPLKKTVTEQGGTEPGPGPGGDYILGDVNNDGAPDLLDASAVIAFYINGVQFTQGNNQPYEYGEQAGDVNGDGATDLIDASDIIAFYINDVAF